MIIQAMKLDSDLEFNHLLKYLPNEKKERVQIMKNNREALRRVFAHILLLDILKNEYLYKWQELEFCMNKYRKPFLKGINLHFNISHTHEWVVCALDNKCIGIDIEKRKPLKYNISRKVFSKYELKKYGLLSSDEKLDYLYRIWTLKESFVKYLGFGLKYPINTVSFDLKEKSATLINSDEEINFKEFLIDEEYHLSICSENICELGNVEIINIKKLIGEWR